MVLHIYLHGFTPKSMGGLLEVVDEGLQDALQFVQRGQILLTDPHGLHFIF